ncbi:MAG: hypothetical protein UX81_C0017G0009 [Parcubacteria group bacterium GW2011_GWA2_47_12]|nr:MAG: hypothetical protein UX81_C0017G0009 [Parcubacteria group bacterium GW2011_GWA2_47_12]
MIGRFNNILNVYREKFLTVEAFEATMKKEIPKTELILNSIVKECQLL